MPLFVGVDWGGADHAVCVVDAGGCIVMRLEVRHDAEGLGELLGKLRQIGRPADLPIAIERPSGLVVETLADAGHPIIPIHPNVVRACRPRYRAAGGKSDRGDAYMLADILRTDGHRFRPLMPMSVEVKALRALVRARDDLVGQRVALTNQLRSLLESFWPGAACVFAAIDSPIALAFIGQYPTPDTASGLGETQMADFMRRNSYSGRRSAATLLARLRAAPTGLATGAEVEAKAVIVRSLAALLEHAMVEIANLTGRIEHLLADLPDGKIIMSFPRTGRMCAAQILAELGDVRERFPTEDRLAAEAGVCPVTHASGKSRGVVFRWACNKNLRTAITCFADNSRHASAWAATIYRNARARGCKHAHAVRILPRAWVRVLWRAWQNRAEYDPARHLGAVRIST